MVGSPVAIKGRQYGYCIPFDTIGACRIGCRRPDIGRRDLAKPTCPSEGKPARPRDGAARRSLQVVHCRGIEAYGEAIVSKEPNVQEFVALYAMISRMRLQSPPQTVACAEKVMRATIDTYFAPSKTIRELHESAQRGSGIDLLKDFSEVAREEL